MEKSKNGDSPQYLSLEPKSNLSWVDCLFREVQENCPNLVIWSEQNKEYLDEIVPFALFWTATLILDHGKY